MTYANREEAGEKTAERVSKFLNERDNTLVIAITKGGVVVADKISKKLKLPLHFMSVKKITFPGMPSMAVGAVGDDGEYILNPRTAQHMDPLLFQAERLRNIRAASNENTNLSSQKLALDVEGATVIVVDDGVYTGTTALTAVELLKNKGAEKIILATPVASREALGKLNNAVDAVVVDTVPGIFRDLSSYYYNFLPEDDIKIKEILDNETDSKSSEDSV